MLLLGGCIKNRGSSQLLSLNVQFYLKQINKAYKRKYKSKSDSPVLRIFSF